MKRYWIHIPCLLHMTGLCISDPCTDPVDLTAVTNMKKTFTSPNYPNKYPNNAMCMWRISAASSGHVIKVQVENSKLEKRFGAYGCAFDYVAVYDGLGTSHKKLGQWCGDSKPSVVSSGSTVTVVFYSDRSYGTTGFEISYVSGPAENFRDAARSSSGTTMMGMVGYLILVLAILSGAMLAIRIILNKVRWCKCMERPRQQARSIFTRRPRRSASDQPRSSSTATEIFVLPVSPPSYEECGGDLDGSPPPYSAIAETPVTPIPGSLPEVDHDNPVFDLERELSPPPPYETVAVDAGVTIPESVRSLANGHVQRSSNDIVPSSDNDIARSSDNETSQSANNDIARSSDNDIARSSDHDNVQSSNIGNIERTNNDNVQSSNCINIECSTNATTATNRSSDTGLHANGDTDVV